MDDVCTLLRDSGLGHLYWVEAASYSVDTRNLIPSRQHPGKIPLEAFTGKRQDVSHLRIFGAKCWAKIPTVHGVQVTGGSKLDPRVVECCFLGAVGTIWCRTSPLAESLCHMMLYLRKVSLTVHRRVWRRIYLFLIRQLGHLTISTTVSQLINKTLWLFPRPTMDQMINTLILTQNLIAKWSQFAKWSQLNNQYIVPLA